MTFNNPGWLWALFALLIPILVHLYNFRKYRKIYFSNVALLEDVQEETQKQSQLKRLLILLSRMLAFAACILAFAEPIWNDISTPTQNQSTLVQVFIDNTSSMQFPHEEGPILEVAKSRAQELIQAYPEGTNFQLLKASHMGLLPTIGTKNRAMEVVQAIDLEERRLPLAKLIQKFNQTNTPESEDRVIRYVISDFQKYQYESWLNTTDSSCTTYFLPLAYAVTNNISIDSVWFESPINGIKQNATIHFRLQNYSDQKIANVPLSIVFNDQTLVKTSLNIDAKSTVDSSLVVPIVDNGAVAFTFNITEAPVTFDNTYFGAFQTAQTVRILELVPSKRNSSFKRLYTNNPAFEFNQLTINEVSLTTFSQYDFIIAHLDQRLSSGLISSIKQAAEMGASVLICPGSDASPSLAQFNELFGSQQLKRVNQPAGLAPPSINQSLLRGVFKSIPERMSLPTFQQFYASKLSESNTRQSVLEFENELPMLARFSVGKGNVFLYHITGDALKSIFSKHYLFVPVQLNMALQSIPIEKVGITHAGLHTISANDKLPRTEHVKLNLLNTEQSWVVPLTSPERNLSMTEIEYLPPGHYAYAHADQPYGFFGLNNSRKESLPEQFSQADLNKIASASSGKKVVIGATDGALINRITSQTTPPSLWKWFIGGALLFFLIEVLLIRLMPN